MPTYAYECAECAHAWDEEQRITEPPSETCPRCTQTAAKRVITAASGFVLRGDGWAKDNYSKR